MTLTACEQWQTDAEIIMCFFFKRTARTNMDNERIVLTMNSTFLRPFRRTFYFSFSYRPSHQKTITIFNVTHYCLFEDSCVAFLFTVF